MKQLREYCLSHHISALWDVPMAAYSSFRIGGRADALLFPETEDALGALLGFLAGAHIPFRVIGNATNLLFSDDGFRGALVTTRRCRAVSVRQDHVRASCGAPVNLLCRAFADASLGGAENLYGIPGTVGGAVRMHAGAFGELISDRLALVSVLDLSVMRHTVLTKEECAFSYRHSIFSDHPELYILSAEFRGIPADGGTIREKMKVALARREAAQPLSLPSVGSTFLRPAGHYAGKLIEEAGLSGARVGDAAVSCKHAGFIVNLGDATAADVLALVALIQTKVKETSGITLIPEMEYIGS